MNQPERLMAAANPRHMILSLSGLSSYYDQNQYFFQTNNRFQSSNPQNYIDIGEYEPPSLAQPDKRWEAPADIDATYQNGSTFIRQENNESIDEYYDRLMRTPSEFTQPTPTGAPTVLYQNLQESKNLDAALEKATTKESGSKKKQSKSRSTTKQTAENKGQEEKPKSTNSESTAENAKPNEANETRKQSNQATTATTTNNQQAANQTQTNIPAQNTNVAQQSTQPTQAPAQNNAKPAQQTLQQTQAPAQNNAKPVQQTLQQTQAVAQNNAKPVQQTLQQTQAPAQNNAKPVQQTLQQTQAPAQNSVKPVQQTLQQTQAVAQNNAKPVQQTLQQTQAPINNQQRAQTNAAQNQSTAQHATQSIAKQNQAIGGHAFQVVQNQPRQIEHRPVGGIAPTAKLPKVHPANPVVFFDIEIDDEKRGTLVMELFRHALPKTSQNFLSLSLGDRGFGYKYSYLHRIIPGFMAQGGDFEKSDGTGGYSIYGPTFNDEGFPFRHDRAGLLSMANSGPNTNGSQFFITFGPAPHLDGKHTVFGQVLQGYHLLDDFRLSGSESGEPVRAVKIANCGQLQ